MKKKIYWKDIWLTIRQSKGRFFSIFSLMMIGSMALVALKVTTPNMERTAQLFVAKTQMLTWQSWQIMAWMKQMFRS